MATRAGRPAAFAHELERADHVADLVVEEAAGLGVDVDGVGVRVTVEAVEGADGDLAWQAVARKEVKSWWPRRWRGGFGHGGNVELVVDVPGAAAGEGGAGAAVRMRYS